MGIGEDLLTVLSSYPEGYRLLRARAYGLPYKALRRKSGNLLEQASENTLRVTLSRLRKRDLVQSVNRGIWKITSQGRNYLLKRLGRTHSTTGNRKVKNMIVAFDIPEKEKKKRDWLRAELSGLGFEMLQKSLWFGPAPLPREFLTTLRDLRILSHLKFFKAESGDIV